MKDGIIEVHGTTAHDLVKRTASKLKPCPFCGEKTGGWISVKDRLPDEKYDAVLIIIFNGTSDAGYWNAEYKLFEDVLHYTVMGFVTHWMPFDALPEPKI